MLVKNHKKTPISGDLLITDIPETVVVTVDGVSTEVEDFNDDGSFPVEYKQGQQIEINATYWSLHRTGTTTTPALISLSGQMVATNGTQQVINLDMTNVEDLPDEVIDVQGASTREACLNGVCSGLPDQTVSTIEWHPVYNGVLAGRSNLSTDATWSSDADGILSINVLKVPIHYYDIQALALVTLPAGKYRWWSVAMNQGSSPATVTYETMEQYVWTTPLSQVKTDTIQVGGQKVSAIEFTLTKNSTVQLTISVGDSVPGSMIGFGQVIVEQMTEPTGKVLPKATAIAAQTSTKFYWPIGTSSYSSGAGNWLERDPANKGRYYKGLYHIGVDMLVPYKSPVYPIASGKIVYISNTESAWGAGNSGVLIEHTTSKNKKFLALYGHVRTKLKAGSKVTGGTAFATVGPYPYSKDHLHFGILKDTKIPKTNWGRMPNSSWKDTNNFVDPVNFIKQQSPK